MRVLASAVVLAAALLASGCGYGEQAMQSLFPSKPDALPPPADTAPPAPAPAATTAPLAPAPAAETRKPFVVIRFEGAPPDYAQPLYDAMRRALARKPDVGFDLVAVTNNDDAAAKHLNAVFTAMSQMGVPASRVTLAAAAAADDATDEVWVYVR